MSLEVMHQFLGLHGDTHQGKVCETIAFGWVCTDMLSFAKTCIDLPGVPLGILEAFLGKK